MYGAATQIEKTEPRALHCQARVVEVFMAGEIEHAKQIVRRWCKESPCCVTITPTTFIYRGGEESGFVVGFRNYPRFPSDPYALRAMAAELADRLREELGQDSYMSVDHGGMATWSTTRDA